MTIVDAETKAPKIRGPYVVPYPNGIGRVPHSDGTVTENASKVLLVRKPNGTVRTSYPNSPDLTTIFNENPDVLEKVLQNGKTPVKLYFLNRVRICPFGFSAIRKRSG
jgi:hypothetical protein